MAAVLPGALATGPRIIIIIMVIIVFFYPANVEYMVSS
jgi:hypothetical protein